MRHASAVVLVAAAALAAVASTSAAPQAPTRAQAVSIYAPRAAGNSCERMLPLKRLVRTPAVLKGAVQALLAGPTRTERARGYGGWFSAKTADHLRSVRIAGGVAYIDFRTFARDIPNASSSCGSTLLLAQLDRTVKQFPTVRSAVYSFDGSRGAFYAWLQREAPTKG
jgi:sporulation and spore germination protein